ncbi:MAG: winged helix DNA-binding domain-containing protein [Actinobacteria bacterium]|nr:MAG: winged helix DNA-binding domain-containing protein [Actinomycetota bacterium]
MTRGSGRERPVLTLRELNRAMLARQLLLERARIGIVAAIERLAALQAQWAPSPYLALWSRLEAFRREKLWSAIERHEVIRARLMRGTLHLVSAGDFYAYAVATQDLQRGAWNRLQIGRGVDPKEIARLAIAFAREPRLKTDVLAHITERIGPSPRSTGSAAASARPRTKRSIISSGGASPRSGR